MVPGLNEWKDGEVLDRVLLQILSVYVVEEVSFPVERYFLLGHVFWQV